MYQDILLKQAKETRFRRSENDAPPLSERRNPACGDEIALFGVLAEGKPCALEYYLQGCAVSAASAAILAEVVNGQDLQTARGRVREALEFFQQTEDWPHDWGVPLLPALGAIRERPMRMACVRLPWEAFAGAVDL